MNIVNQLTIRCLKLNKRRTAVTAIAIALSILMLTAVFSTAVSFLDMLKRENIAGNGEWHAQLTGVSAEKLTDLEHAEHVKAVLLTREVGFAPFEDSTNAVKKYYYVKEYNAAAFAYLQRTVLEGRFPQREGEAVLSQEALDAGCPYRIGDTVTLTIGYRTDASNQENRLGNDIPYMLPQDGAAGERFHPEGQKNYRITGIVKTQVSRDTSHVVAGQPGVLLIGYCNAATFAGADETASPQLVFDPLRSSIFGEVETLARQVDAGEYTINHTLLKFEGVAKQVEPSEAGLLTAAALALLAILAGFAAMIYNAFAISVAERTQYLGLLASVGATGRQKRLSVFLEGAILGAIAIPAGLVAGLGGVALLLLALNPLVKNVTGVSQDLRLVVFPPAILATVVLSALLIALSLYVPARRAARTTPIHSIRQTNEIRLTAKAVRTGRLTRRIFGIEGEIALKNLKRSRGRYRITVAALAVSVVMVLTVSYAAKLYEDKFDLQEPPCDMLLKGYDASSKEIFQKVLDQGEITRYTYRTPLRLGYGRFAQRQVDPDYVRQERENVGIRPTQGGYDVPLSIYALDEASFQAYLKELGEKWEDYQDPGRFKGILINTYQYKEADSQNNIRVSIRPVFHLSAGERITLTGYPQSQGADNAVLGTVEVGQVTQAMPFGFGNHVADSDNSAYFLVPQKTGEAMRAAYAPDQEGLDLCINTNRPDDVRRLLQEIRMSGKGQVDLIDYAGMREESRQLIQMLSIFCAVVVALIVSVSAASMFNTISTNLILRRREFAMLRCVGMTQKSFRRMLRYESLFYGLKTLLYGLPISFALMAVIYWAMKEYDTPFTLPWLALAGTVAALFLIVGGTMLYTGRKLKKDNIIEVLKNDMI